MLVEFKEDRYQVGAGFMVGLPEQTNEDFVKDLHFLKRLQPHMVGIGPLYHIKIHHWQIKKMGQ
jgi:biotin synthase